MRNMLDVSQGCRRSFFVSSGTGRKRESQRRIRATNFHLKLPTDSQADLDIQRMAGVLESM